MKRPLKIGLILAGAVILTALTIAANVARSHSQVHGIDVSIRCVGTPQLVDEQVVADSILAALPHLYATRVGDVNRDKVVSTAMHVPFIEEASASVSVSGKVVVKTKQRRPIARVFYGKRELYMDENGAMFPTSKMAECNVLVASGEFTEPLVIDSLNSQMQALLEVAKFLDLNKNYSILIDQLYIESDGNIMMVSKLGDNTIELGDASNLNEKFSNLWTFYRKGMPRAGWNTYNKISLKYNGQVVCTKDKKQQ